jgi:2-succinyl-5-enolpyruvyl-6-hydroxy-3-cyclohexene-1-carboxylate synthase
LELSAVLVNNFSGGIFTLLPIDSEKNVIKYISSPHDITFEKVAALTETKYYKISDEKLLASAFLDFCHFEGHAIFEILIDNEINKKMYSELRTIKI